MWVSGGFGGVGRYGERGGTEGTTATESLDVSVTLPVSTMTHLHADCQGVVCSGVAPHHPPPVPPPPISLSQTTALFERKQKQHEEQGPERPSLPSENSLSHHPPLLSAQTTAVHEPRCNWKNLGGGRGVKRRDGAENKRQTEQCTLHLTSREEKKILHNLLHKPLLTLNQQNI